MKKNLRIITGGLGAIVTLALASCAYDPYYGGSSGSYSSYGGGYGSGYGYGGSSFSTSLFVSTGNPRWGYDPYCRSYYDYNRRAYYDPYLYGYYPVGYRPPVIVGVPHPHGWLSGSRYCPPPSRVNNITLVNYRNRESAYRSSNHSWARQVHQQPSRDSRDRYQRDQRDDNRSNWDRSRSSSRDPRADGNFRNSRDSRDGRDETPTFKRGSDNDRSFQDRRQPRASSGYNTPVEVRPSQPVRPTRQQPEINRSDDRRDLRESSNFERPSSRSSGFERQAPAPSQRGGSDRGGEKRDRGDEKRDRGDDKDRGNSRDGRVRGLGQG